MQGCKKEQRDFEGLNTTSRAIDDGMYKDDKEDGFYYLGEGGYNR